MNICKDCICRKYCGDDDIRRCDRYFRDGIKKELTNEEWFCTLPTEEKAKWLYDHYVNARADEYYGRQEKTLSEYQKWLVSVHREIDGTRVG